MIPIKLIAIPAGSIVGILGVTSPLMHIGITSSTYKQKWHSKLNFSGPILENCQAGNGRNYTLFLEFDSGGADRDQNNRVSFRVEETNGLWDKAKEKKIVWRGGKGVKGQGKNWETWKLDKKTSDVLDFMYPDSDRFLTTNNCEKRKIKPSSAETFGSGQPVEVKDIKLVISPDQNCTKYLGGVECDINIEADNKLKWDDGFKPKVIWTAF